MIFERGVVFVDGPFRVSSPVSELCWCCDAKDENGGYVFAFRSRELIAGVGAKLGSVELNSASISSSRSTILSFSDTLSVSLVYVRGSAGRDGRSSSLGECEFDTLGVVSFEGSMLPSLLIILASFGEGVSDCLTIDSAYHLHQREIRATH